MKSFSALFFIALLFVTSVSAAETYSTPSLSYESATKILSGSLKEAGKQQRNVAIAVVDANGEVIASARMDGAKTVAMALAVKKAKTALLFRGSSRTAMEEINNGSQALLSLDDLAALPGGLALNNNGEFIGAVGVSGAPADIDELIAEAGVKRLQN